MEVEACRLEISQLRKGSELEANEAGAGKLTRKPKILNVNVF